MRYTMQYRIPCTVYSRVFSGVKKWILLEILLRTALVSIKSHLSLAKLTKRIHLTIFRIFKIKINRNDYFDCQTDDWISKKNFFWEIVTLKRRQGAWTSMGRPTIRGDIIGKRKAEGSIFPTVYSVFIVQGLGLKRRILAWINEAAFRKYTGKRLYINHNKTNK